jgi:hypothetical protein
MDTLNQPMTQQNPFFYQNKHTPNPANINQFNPGFGNFQKVFNPLPPILYNGQDPKSIFNNHGFINQHDMLHNNLTSILLNEEIREYSVLIDSKDRNYQMYPDPFRYDVIFDPLPKSREVINGKTVIYEQPGPVINDKFINVRYIKLENVILPFFTKVRVEEEQVGDDEDEVVTRLKVDTKRPLTENLYTVLSLGAYQDINYRSTNDVLGDSFATIYYSDRINDTHFGGYTKNGIKIFQQDQLVTIDKLKINFMDPYGCPLSCSHIDRRIRSNFECTCNDPDGDDDTICFRHNLRHPLNPIFQHHLHFKIGIVEPRLGKLTFS